MGYEWLGRLHAAMARAQREARGQGTVEYVGLVLLMAVVLAGVVAAADGLKSGTEIPQAIVGKLKEAIDGTKAK